jgi:hypothetical protein
MWVDYVNKKRKEVKKEVNPDCYKRWQMSNKKYPLLFHLEQESTGKAKQKQQITLLQIKHFTANLNQSKSVMLC